MPSVRQPSFASGELSPSLRGRTDIERYASGLKGGLNFIISPQGAALNRPGTTYVASAKANAQVRLVPFVLSGDDAMVLEFGNLYVRFFKNGEAILSGLTPYEVATPYTTAQLRYLKFAQVGDVLDITHSAHSARELSRTADDDWDLDVFNFEGVDNDMYLQPGLDAATLPVANSEHPAREWLWQVTQVLQDPETGATFESLPTTVTVQWTAAGPTWTSSAVSSLLPVYFDRPVTVRWPVEAHSPPAGWDYYTVAYRIYRGRGRLFGFLGETRDEYFIDQGEEPDKLIQPPQGTNPFEVRDITEAIQRTEEPIAVGFYKQRLILGGTAERPGTVWGSKVGVYDNFDTILPRAENGSFEFALASHRRESIRSVLGMDRLFLFTSGGVWTMDGLGVELVPNITKHTDEGASWVSPLIVGDSILYVREKGVGVNDIGFQNERGKLTATDLTPFARHLLEDSPIVEWAYAHDPLRIVWAVREDGVLLSMTYQREQNVLAWTPHETQGTVESVCVVPEGNEDAVYLAVQRGSARFIERMSTRKVDEDWSGASTEACFLDAAVLRTGAATRDITGLEHLEGLEVSAVADGYVMGPFTVEDGAIELPRTAVEVQVGLSYTSDLEVLDIAGGKTELKGKRKNVTQVLFEVQDSRGFSAGESLEGTLVPWVQRSVADDYNPLTLFTGDVQVAVVGTWNTGGAAVLRQADPTPLTVLGLTRKVVLGDD